MRSGGYTADPALHSSHVISYLKVRNLAIVEEFAIEPGPGLNVLTGETGAGKSLLIDSLEFLRGSRGSSETIRGGAEKMTAEALFHLPEGDEVIVKREIATTGRGRAMINDSLVSIRDLSEAMDAILDIHGQSESHLRVAGQTYRELLDDYAGHDLEETRGSYKRWRDAAEQLRELTDAQRDRALRIDLLRYQIEEISAAKLEAGEEKPLRGEKSILAHAREMIEVTAGAFRLVEEDENAALGQLARAIHLLQPLSRDIVSIGDAASELQEIVYRLQDVARKLSSLSESARHDPARLEEIEERLVTIDRLKKKYGGSIDAALAHLETIREEHARLTDYEGNLHKLQKVEQQHAAAYRAAAEGLSRSRHKAARAFEKAIQAELQDLAMERTTVRVVVENGNDGADGFDRVDILVAPNLGEEPKPMQRIASGGELSRIQLAIAAALFKTSPRSAAATLVFDEIDAGIGGQTAHAVGRTLERLAERAQVITITHLPQIASLAGGHFRVEKVPGDPTHTSIQLLDPEQRREELERMLGGQEFLSTLR